MNKDPPTNNTIISNALINKDPPPDVICCLNVFSVLVSGVF